MSFELAAAAFAALSARVATPRNAVFAAAVM